MIDTQVEDEDIYPAEQSVSDVNSSHDEFTPDCEQTDMVLDNRNCKFGIVYLSYIPDGLTVKILREIMGQFGETGRIFLEPDPNNLTSKRKKYIEGWVEFKKKRVAKQVAAELNGKEISYGRKHSILSGQIWSLKYLHKFKWCHLTEQLAMDKATREQRRRFEMSQSKKQADFYQKMTERSRLMKKKKAKSSDGPETSNAIKYLKLKQNNPVGKGDELSVKIDSDLLGSIFKKVA